MTEGLVQEIPTAPDNPYPLGRSMVHHDPRNFLFRALNRPTRPARTLNIAWWTLDVYDQISDDCTANAAIGVLRTSPHFKTFPFATFHQYNTQQEKVALYEESRKFDPWPGEDYAGTSTDAPWRVLRNRGQIPGWQWLFGLDEMKEWLLYYGPVAVGTNWYESMFFPDSKGYIHIGGGLAGGHAWRVVYYNPKKGFRMINSWSRDWGQAGRAWVTEEEMGELLRQYGEVVTL